jgi:uncharacterized protein (TIGR00730 family)
MEREIVSVFGASSPQEGSVDYDNAYRVGEALAQAGYAVMTGGYGGTMEAASKGAKSGGGFVIGVTAALFERRGYRSGPNRYVDQVIRYDTLRKRLYHLVERCDGAVVLPGGIGTLSEMALTWSLMQVGEIGRKPFILYGEWWEAVIRGFVGDGRYVRERDMSLWQVANSPQEVVELLSGQSL